MGQDNNGDGKALVGDEIEVAGAPDAARGPTAGSPVAEDDVAEDDLTDPRGPSPAAPPPRPPSKSTHLILWLAVFGLLIITASSLAVVLLLDSVPSGLATSAEAEWLHVKVSPATTDAPGNEGLLADPLDLPPLTTELTAMVRHAATDPEIGGLFLEVQPVGMGWAQLQELRAALADFQAANKPCVAWAETLTNKEYYLATACGELHLAPAGLVLVNGLSVTQMYYAGAFEKYGISSNFEHVGDFKSAVEPYERTGPSESASEATDALLDDLYGQLVAGIAEGRGIEIEAARALVDDPPITPTDAHEAGMVDAISFRDQVMETRIEAELTGQGEYLRSLRSEWSGGGDLVAVIHAEGAIISGESGSDLFGGAFIGDLTLRKQLKTVREDDDIKAVVLRVNSPGGSGMASDSIWREIQRTREKKPVIISMADYAASGGYYIAAGSERIFAEPGTITGSIGVFGGKINLSGAYEKLGLSLHHYERGRYSKLLSSSTDFDELERVKFRRFLENFYDVFIDRVASGRAMDVEAVHAVAQGRVWTGQQALERGLVDELGGLDAAVAYAAQSVGVEGPPTVRRFPERRGFLDQLIEEMSAPPDDAAALVKDAVSGAAGPAARAAGELMGPLVMLERVLGPAGVAALLPGELEVR